ncbi:MAG: hypothetical protein J6P61_10330 [Erysipelotrichaceae bacterium]|nr:hypothetical protein [Erysipelotrichaceae bacterium]
MKHIIIKMIAVMLILVGCTSKPVTKVTLDPPVTLEFYAIAGCSECEIFKSKAIPYLQKTFGKSLKIAIYDMDDESVTAQYDSVINALKDFDEEYYGHSPFMVVKNYFAVLGYNGGDEKYLANDIIASVEGKSLSSELAPIRFEYKQTSKEE